MRRSEGGRSALAGAASASKPRSSASADFDELDVEVELGIGGDDAAGAAGAVAERGRDDELALLARPHRDHALVPALDHLAHADLELEGLAAVARAVEL